jgi:hypothetical protein
LVINAALPSRGFAAQANSITQFGITWTFDKNYTVGQFANGDYWIVGPVTIIGIDPCSTNVGGVIKNGSMINPSTDRQGFDNRTLSNWDASLNVALDIKPSNPLVIEPNASLISSISRTTPTSYNYLLTAAVLTVLSSAPPSGSFRPPYFDTTKDIRFNESDLNYSLLASLTPVPDTESLATVERYFERPWLDWLTQDEGRHIHPTDNMPDYGGTIGNQIGIGALTLHLNYTNVQKRTLLTRYVQLGIDYYAIVSNSNFRTVWGGLGGTGGCGRKWPMMFAGIILNDSAMKNIGTKSGDYYYSSYTGFIDQYHWPHYNPPADAILLGEDCQTFYVGDNDIYTKPYWMGNWAANYTAGNVAVTKNSNIVQGTSTGWTADLIGKYFGTRVDEVRAYSGNQCGYLIDNVNVTTQQITLHTPYEGETATITGGNYGNWMISDYITYGHGHGLTWPIDYNEFTESDRGHPYSAYDYVSAPYATGPEWNKNYMGEMCTNWPGFVLAALIMQSGSSAKTLWNHNALFDFMDYYMADRKARGYTGSPNYRCYSPFVEEMWDTYRANYGSIWAAALGSDNRPPNADSGPDQTLTASANGAASVTLDGSHSSSPNGSIVSYVWTEGGSQIAAVANPTVALSIGRHTITLRVTDNSGLTDTDTVVITVEPPTIDAIPPSIKSVTATEYSVEIQFSEPLDGASASNAGNYGLSDSLKINSVWLETGYNRVLLYTDKQTDGKTYTLNVVNVKDVAGNAMTQTSVTYTYDSGLVGCYLFSDAGDSYILDSSGHNNTGYYINGAHRTDQQEAILGGGDAVQIPTADWNAAQGTVALWINATSVLGTQYIFGHSDENEANLIQLYTDNGYLCVGMGDNHLLKTSIQLLSPQTWYHITLSWDGTNYSVYVNGSLSATGTYTGLTLLSSLADIGNTGGTTSRTEGFQGLIDEVRIYNRVLTAAEISNLALMFLPIGDKTVAEGDELSFTIRTRPDVTMTLAESNLPSLPSLVSNTFSWTPGYTDAGTYEVEFAAPHGTSMDFEKVTIKVTDTNLPEINSPPIGYWKFDETSGDIASDSSAYGDTGYLENGLTWGTGKINGAIVFSVPNDAVEIETTNFNLQQGTIAMWVYVQRQTLSRHYFFGHVTGTTNRIQLYDKYGYLCLGLGDSHETSVNIQRLQNERWYHIVLTWNKPTYNVYVNGVLKASGTYSGLTAFADHADIGNNGFGRDMGLNGKIDDVQIYNRVLNTDEIIRLDVGY